MHGIILTINQVIVLELKYNEDIEQKKYMCNADLLILLQKANLHKAFKDVSNILMCNTKVLISTLNSFFFKFLYTTGLLLLFPK